MAQAYDLMSVRRLTQETVPWRLHTSLLTCAPKSPTISGELCLLHLCIWHCWRRAITDSFCWSLLVFEKNKIKHSNCFLSLSINIVTHACAHMHTHTHTPHRFSESEEAFSFYFYYFPYGLVASHGKHLGENNLCVTYICEKFL